MKYLSVKLFGLLIFVFLFVSFSLAQATTHDLKAAVEAFQNQKPVSLTKNGQLADQKFTILRPSDISSLADWSLMSSAGDPCMMALPILFGQEIIGTLTNEDCQLDDMSYADFYTFEGLAGEQIQIDMTSGAFDTYLGVANESGTWVIEDDDGGGGGNSRIIATLPESGTFFILANSFSPNQFGTYHIRLLGGPNCTFAFSPTSADVPASSGTYSFSLTTGPRCYWATGGSGFITTNSTGLGDGIVNYNVAANPINQQRTDPVTVVDNRRNYRYFYVTQAGMSCTYLLTQSSVNVGPAQTTGSFSVTAPQGCFWSTQFWSSFLSANGSANGNGTVNYTVYHNNGANRSGSIRIGDQVSNQIFTINQTGLNCTYSISPTSLNVPSIGTTGNYVINTQPGCTWGLTRTNFWIEIQTGSGSGPATLPFSITPHTERSTRSGAIQFSYSLGETVDWINTYIDQAGPISITAPDFDGDKRTDLSIFRSGPGEWWINRSSTGVTSGAQFGASADRIVPGDYTGDGRTDIAFWRPSTGQWFVLRSEDSSFFAFPFGANGDTPVPADYDGDGKTDAAVFRESTLTWFIQKSMGGTDILTFGAAGDKPVVADYDGDGKADIAIFRPAQGEWWIRRSSNASVFAVQFGVNSDRPVQGDFTADGKADIAFWRPSTGFWYVLRSEDASFLAFPWGTTGDIPVPGDYDGDRRVDSAVFRPSDATWFINRSSTGIAIRQFGLSSDTPVPSAFVP